MPEYQKQHYIPQFLLKKWHTPPDNKLSAFWWANGRLSHRRYGAKSAGKMDDIYSMRRSSVKPDVRIERDFLGPIVDGPAALVFQLIIKNGVRVLTLENQIDWARFIISLLHRTPAQMKSIRNDGAKTLALELKDKPEEYLVLHGKNTEKTLREYAEKNVNPDILDDMGARVLPALVTKPELNLPLLNSIWMTRILKQSQNNFLVGDKPLICNGSFKTSFVICLLLTPKIVFLLLILKKQSKIYMV